MRHERERGKDVAAIVAGSGDADDAALTPVAWNERGNRDTGVAHQRDLAAVRDLLGVERAHTLGVEDDHCSRMTTAAAIVAVCVIVR